MSTVIPERARSGRGRTETVRVRLSPVERGRLELIATEASVGLSDVLRAGLWLVSEAAQHDNGAVTGAVSRIFGRASEARSDAPQSTPAA
jgi:hypothetical protein